MKLTKGMSSDGAPRSGNAGDLDCIKDRFCVESLFAKMAHFGSGQFAQRRQLLVE
ncbi:MAG: hypothetical protein N2C12_07135 [Planctomycetales bacterium]